MNHSWQQRVGWAAVAAQAVLLAGLVAPGPPGRSRPVVVTGWALSLAGLLPVVAGSRVLGTALTPTPVPRAGPEPVSSGIYRQVRHPLYTGLLVVAAGRVLSVGARRAPWAAALVCLLRVKAGWEERMLSAQHPSYERYRATTPMFIPRPETVVRRPDQGWLGPLTP